MYQSTPIQPRLHYRHRYPEEVAQVISSHTGMFLKPMLDANTAKKTQKAKAA